jgi:DNA-binding GntR family transcriptional regulator
VKRTASTTPKRASDLAYEQMLERILDLRLPPGAVINEHAVAAELDLSRMPVHEAVGRLAADRFVTVLPRRGSVVTTFGVDEVLDLFEAREAVECGLAYIAARRANAEDLAELRRLVLAAEQAREGSDHMAFLRDDHEIHSLLVHMVPNPLLQDAAERLLLHNLRFWRSYWSSRPAQYATMISHADLLTALEAGDADAAESAMRQHISASLKLLSSSF